MKIRASIILILLSAVVVASNDNLRTVVINQYRTIIEPLFAKGESTQPKFDLFYMEMVEGFDIQTKAEKVLELAINRFDGATDYIMQNAQSWRGKIERTPRLTTLITTAINAPLIEIRMAGFELYLAHNDLAKSADQVDILLRKYANNPKGSAPWALWSMAVIGARGVDREHIFNELLYATEEENSLIRRWAVDSMAIFGGEEIVMPLLSIAASDSSPIVQERAFCGLAQSATLHVIERYYALEGLLVIIRDAKSNEQTRNWAYQALKEISNFYDLDNNPDAWEKRLLDMDMIQSY